MLKHFKNVANNTYEFLLFGDIGEGSKIDGDSLAMDISYLQDWASEIVLRINSGGGGIVNGMSLIAAIQNSKIPVTAVNEGIAASMAAVVFLSAPVRHMRDYAKLMIHDPLFGGMTTDDLDKDSNEYKAADSLRDSLLTIVTSNCNLTRPQVKKMFSEETWIDAKQAKEWGMCEKILKSTRKLEAPTNLYNAVAYFTEIYKSQTNSFKMKNLTAYLKLDENSNEEVVINAVKGFETKIQTITAQLAEKEKAVDQLTAQVTNLKAVEEKQANELKEFRAVLAEKVVDAAISQGKFKAENKDGLVAKATADLKGFEALVEMIPAQKVQKSITSQIANSEEKDERTNWGFREWSEKDPEGLAKMRVENAAKFEKLLSDYTKQ